MKLRALFLGGIVALGLMSFSAKIGDTLEPIDPGTCKQSSSLNDGTCNGSTNPCCASPGRYLG
ncbi:hypothetical protein HNP24_000714 [Chryseobacterium sediminis]|uniref:WAP domain-containing protein n=1 Tax=Chryseobacterium sediminis TaxID=1679494 RepID=A0ABR6PZU0_9FLAO|nr:hypothetical protein [Chryseobacterium sediminis]